MLFDLFRHEELRQCTPEEWKKQWQSLVPPENRDVPITYAGQTVIAFIQINHYVMMLQDGLLMEASFFDVCEFFQLAGYHVIWLMRCTQDIANGYVKKLNKVDAHRTRWAWKRPTTNFGRWMSDSYGASIVIQTAIAPGDTLTDCKKRILQRVVWAESDAEEKMIPGHTTFVTTDTPATPTELLEWISGKPLSSLGK